MIEIIIAGAAVAAALVWRRPKKPQYAPRVPSQPDPAVNRRIANALALPVSMYPGGKPRR
jgi:hypothetical protein